MERLLVYIMSNLFTPGEMTEMEEVISSFLKKNGITLLPPVDIFKLATELDFDVRAANLSEEIEGLLIVDESSKKISGFRTSKVIGYNIKFDLIKNKFTVAHELAHYIDEKMSPGNQEAKIVIAAREPCSPGYSDNADEQRKDYMAAALLIPKDDLLKKLPEDESSWDDQFYQTLADYYRVDLRLAKRRVEEVFSMSANQSSVTEKRRKYLYGSQSPKQARIVEGTN